MPSKQEHNIGGPQRGTVGPGKKKESLERLACTHSGRSGGAKKKVRRKFKKREKKACELKKGWCR